MRCPTAEIEIAGHTDADGEDAVNQTLSEKRAQAVLDYLVRAGLPASRFTPIGYGSSQPVASNDTDEGKAQNRRIDFLVR
jgi:OOP family OmpA-OmpF porin